MGLPEFHSVEEEELSSWNRLLTGQQKTKNSVAFMDTPMSPVNSMFWLCIEFTFRFWSSEIIHFIKKILLILPQDYKFTKICLLSFY